MIKQFRKKPVVIKAWKIPEVWEAPDFGGLKEFIGDEGGQVGLCLDGLDVHTPEGIMHGSPGDWLIRGVKGELYPCKPDIFEATYEDAEEAASHKEEDAKLIQKWARAVNIGIGALRPFAEFADHRRQCPPSHVITQGSPLAKKQLTMGDCYRAADALFEVPYTHIHKGRGSRYRVIGIARLQSSILIGDEEPVTVYEGADGEMWARPTHEFNDGRFEKL